MTNLQDNPLGQPDRQPQALTDEAAKALLQSLRRKEGNWVAWGQGCQRLQQSGYSPQAIFEATGFEPIHQNQVMVAAQVFQTLAAIPANAEVLEHFSQRGSDVLYELRILPSADRVRAAEFAQAKGLDCDDVRELAKVLRDLTRHKTLPDGFTSHPGDAIAYACWQTARQQSDLQARSRLIARGLRFAHTNGARQQLEALLTDFTVATSQAIPRWPLYRVESSAEVPRIVPVAGQWPLQRSDLDAVPLVEDQSPFRMVTFSGTGAWVPLPGWQAVMAAEDPIAILGQYGDLPHTTGQEAEPVLVLVDRAQRQWDAFSYFLVDQGNGLLLNWFETAPEGQLLGRVVLVLRPPRVLDQDLSQDPWQVEE